jgi:hypothetical protein
MKKKSWIGIESETQLLMKKHQILHILKSSLKNKTHFGIGSVVGQYIIYNIYYPRDMNKSCLV